MLTAADDNRDGMLQEAELKSPMFQPIKANFAAVDSTRTARFPSRKPALR
jgi:hypothetical protein